jgi:glycosyltransferase involved in cell wall biosynthesis
VPNILIVDSGSNDQTIPILSKYGNVVIVQRSFDTFAQQCNFALSTHISTPWVLSLDADYCLEQRLSTEIIDIFRQADLVNYYHGFKCSFVYCIHGHPLRGSLLPPRVCLYRVQSACYQDEGHGHRLVIDGPVKLLNGYIRHDDRKPLSRWLYSQTKYMQIEANMLSKTPFGKLSIADRIRKHSLLAPVLVFFYAYIFKLGFLDGLPGLMYALQRVYAELLLILFLLHNQLTCLTFSDRRLQNK